MDNQATCNSLKGIAIIGMAGRFPGANSIDQFWQNLCTGVESISFFTDEELVASGVDSALLHDPNYVKAGAVLDDIELFDARFFGFSAREAEVMDPQHRLFLECAWEALENAGYDPEADEGLTGVYAGGNLSSYLLNNLLANPELINSLGRELVGISNDKDYIPTRVSYKLNLKGPSFNVSTACSTSLVAVHLACRGLLSYECDLALAGGIAIQVPQKAGYFYQPGGMTPPDGHCHAFDAKAQGSLFGSGVGIVVLKRLEDALADGDCINAVIKGSAINNDGSLKVSYTAPSVEGQAEAIAQSQAIAGFNPETITYIETHGTGTALGDPIEIRALEQVFRASTQKKGFCGIGSVKTNVGHLNSASGVTNLIKTVLALKHKLIPPTLHFEAPNPNIDLANSPFYVNTKLSEWKTNGTPRRAGVSSFGLGGTNAHVVLEEAPTVECSGKSRPWQLLVLSAKTSSALETATVNLAEHLRQDPDLNLADLAYTLQVGRHCFDHRRVVICQDIEDAAIALQDPKRVLTSIQATSDRPIAFMFTGLGTHYINMAWELYQVEPTFQTTVDRCCEILKPLLGLDLRDVLYPYKNQTDKSHQPANPTKSASPSVDLRRMLGRGEEPASEATQTLNQTALTQPAIFIIEFALAQLLQSWGIHPVAMIGYSLGEYVAACLAEVLSLEDALTLVAKRAQMIQALPGGAMLAVPLSKDKVYPLLNENLSLSAINGSSVCVIAGTTNAVDELASQLTEKGLAYRRLQTSHAFHSHMMEPLANSFTELVKTISLHPPKIPYLSNVTGIWITADQATDPNYWTKHLCQPVLFADGLNELWKQYQPILLEIGPGQTLSSLTLQCLESVPVADKLVLPSLPDAYNQQSDLSCLLNTLGQLWLSGVQIDWSKFYTHERRFRLPLPTYPFERQRYWIEPPKLRQAVPIEPISLDKKPDIADWFYIPTWKQSMPPVPFEVGSLAKQTSCWWLLFIDECGVGLQVAQRLEDENQDVIRVRAGEQFSQLSEGEYTINPRKRDDYSALFNDLRAKNQLPKAVVHLWSIKLNEPVQSDIELFEAAQSLGFYSLLFLTQAIGRQLITDSLQLWVLSNNMHEVESTDVLYPEKATFLGLCHVIPQEYTNITCRSIDLVLPQPRSQQEGKLIGQILTELTTPSDDLTVAYRGNHRWIQDFESVRLDDRADRTRLRQGGVYLITGGLGKLGLMLGKHLAQSVQAKLVLIGRSGLPAKEEWDQWLATHNQQERVSSRIKHVQELEELGAEVLVISADVANEAQMQAAITQAEQLFGKIHGVIHAAGVVEKESFRPISETGYTDCELHFQPKVHGVYTLKKVLQGRELDYCLLISSVSSVLGGLGFAAYSSANSFLDAFARKQNRFSDNNWCSTDWFLVDVPEEIAEAFRRILSQGTLSQIVISQIDLQTQINQWIKRQSWQGEAEANGRANSSLYLRPNLRNAFVAPSSETEQRIARRYEQLLGVEHVGVHDSFFDLGGNSLIGTQMISKLRQDFNLEISISLLFEAPTVAVMSEQIETLLTTQKQQSLTTAAFGKREEGVL